MDSEAFYIKVEEDSELVHYSWVNNFLRFEDNTEEGGMTMSSENQMPISKIGKKSYEDVFDGEPQRDRDMSDYMGRGQCLAWPELGNRGAYDHIFHKKGGAKEDRGGVRVKLYHLRLNEEKTEVEKCGGVKGKKSGHVERCGVQFFPFGLLGRFIKWGLSDSMVLETDLEDGKCESPFQKVVEDSSLHSGIQLQVILDGSEKENQVRSCKEREGGSSLRTNRSAIMELDNDDNNLGDDFGADKNEETD
ncbi:hypothetical protein QYF36_019401 [Acer negundo]|nr:hypothetical protein QYF36_019401 [Acer negundo]